MNNVQTRVIVVDPSPMIRQGISQLLNETASCGVVAEAGDGPAALFAASAHDHNMVLINVALPGSDIYDVVETLARQHERCKFIATFIGNDVNLLNQLRKSGVDGFIGREAAPGEYLAAVRAVAAGGSYLSESLADLMFRVGRTGADAANKYGLTGRELEILSQLASGLCNKEIANKYDLSVRTVETHRLNIRRKTGSNTLSDLVRVARGIGIPSLADTTSDSLIGA